MKLLFRDAWVLKLSTGVFKSYLPDMERVLWHGRLFDRKGEAEAFKREHADLAAARVVKVRVTIETLEG